MTILYLGPDSPLVEWLEGQGNDVIFEGSSLERTADFLISYNYKKIIPKRMLDEYPKKAINLHVSYLPWNRGAHPNFWAHYKKTPSGVTIHYLDEGIDTGDIIVQKRVGFSKDDTLRTSYNKLHREIQKLFKKNWNKIKNSPKGKRQPNGGSFHLSKEMPPISWDTPIDLIKVELQNMVNTGD